MPRFLSRHRLLALVRRQPAVAGAVLIVAIGLAIYGQAATFDFSHWDDPNYITDNYDVLGGLSWEGVRWALTSTYFSNWHPLTWLSHQFAWSLFGPWAGGHHLINVVLHLANASLCLVFLLRATAAPWRSLLVALLFLVHPLHVETVAWLSDRKGLLAAFFWWLALLAWLDYARGGGRRAYGLALLAHACALMAKPMAVSLPLVLFALDRWPLARYAGEGPAALRWSRALLEKLPFLLLSVLAAAVTYHAQDQGGAVVPQSYLPLADRLTNAIVAYQDYLFALVWPSNLSFFYAYPPTWPVGRILLAMLVGVVLLYGVLTAHARHPHLLAGWWWFTVMLGPVIGLVQVGSQSHADRYMYLTSTGAFIALAWSLPALSRSALRRAAAALAAIVILLLGWAAHRQAAVWRDSETLYRSALAINGQNYVAHLLLSERLIERGAVDEAEHHAGQALRLSDTDSVHAYSRRVLGRVFLARGDYEAARRELRATMDLLPSSPKANLYMGMVDLADGRPADAEFWLRRALVFRPRFPEALEALAALYAAEGRWTLAAELQQHAANLRPWLAAPLLTLADYRQAAGDAAGAAALRDDVVRRFPPSGT